MKIDPPRREETASRAVSGIRLLPMSRLTLEAESLGSGEMFTLLKDQML